MTVVKPRRKLLKEPLSIVGAEESTNILGSLAYHVGKGNYIGTVST